MLITLPSPSVSCTTAMRSLVRRNPVRRNSVRRNLQRCVLLRRERKLRTGKSTLFYRKWQGSSNAQNRAQRIPVTRFRRLATLHRHHGKASHILKPQEACPISPKLQPTPCDVVVGYGRSSRDHRRSFACKARSRNETRRGDVPRARISKPWTRPPRRLTRG